MTEVKYTYTLKYVKDRTHLVQFDINLLSEPRAELDNCKYC